MKVVEFIRALEGIPTYRAIFRLTRVPQWMSVNPAIKVGDMLYAYEGDDTLYHVKSEVRFLIRASYLEFVGYEPCQ